jgi:hypothetical protein
MTIDDDDNDRVGYCKPPKHTRFKPGQSGNPKGKKKGTRNFSSQVMTTLQMPVVLTDSGKPRKVTTSEAALLRLREKALKGDGQSLDRLLGLCRQYGEEVPAAAQQVNDEDAAILADYAARILETLKSDRTRKARAPIPPKGKPR